MLSKCDVCKCDIEMHQVHVSITTHEQVFNSPNYCEVLSAFEQLTFCMGCYKSIRDLKQEITVPCVDDIIHP